MDRVLGGLISENLAAPASAPGGPRALAGGLQLRPFVKTKRAKKPRKRPGRRWTNLLAAMAAEGRTDGGAGLILLLARAGYDQRPSLSLTKRAA